MILITRRNITKQIFTYLVIAFLIFASNLANIRTSQAAQDQWENITPTGTSGYSFNTVATVGNYVLLGTNHGLFTSSDNGSTWSAAQISSQNITTLAIAWTYTDHYAYDSGTPVFVGTSAGGVYSSTLGDSDWTPVNNGLSDLNVSTLVIDQYDALLQGHITIYAGTSGSSNYGVYRSDDNGGSWHLVSIVMAGKKIKKLTTDIGNALIYSLTTANEIYSSTLFSLDYSTEENWTPIRTNDGTTINSLTMSNAAFYTNFLSTNNGIFESDTSGQNWTAANSGLTTSNIRAVGSDYLDTNIFYAASDQGVFKSIDAAVSWVKINKNLSDANIKAINTDPSSSTLVYAIGASGIYILKLVDPYDLPVISDTTAPIAINNLTAANPSANSINLLWIAPSDPDGLGQASLYDIRYSTTDPTFLNDSLLAAWWNGATQIANEPTPQTAGASETYTAVGLNTDTSYWFAIKSADENNNVSDISVLAGTATLAADTVPPVISNIASTTTAKTATTTWSTDEPATSQINYGLTSTYGSTTILNGSLVLSHTVGITGLLSNTMYHYRIRTKDASGNEKVSGDYIFKTYLTADLNYDGHVNSVDAGIMMSNWSSTSKPRADINLDGIVNSVDAGIMMSQWTS